MTSVLDFLKLHVGKENINAPSPMMKWLNPVILSAEKGALSLRYKIRKEWTNPMGILHGGATAAIVDDTIGVTSFTYGEDHYYATINLNIDYLSSAKENDIIIAEATVIKKGRQFINAQCDIWNESKSRLIAKGYSNMFKTEVKIPTL
ncbi:PaaI family thioesterase [Cytophagaceae bacterium ABcell3]|nr:PaaI family thioesterase [Cytophagaceae bacterium ABcell3]